jgi:uncharacterized protein YcbX
MLTVSQLFIYPIKSLGGIEVSSAEVDNRGLKNDRRWMLVDDNNRFMTQRENLKMALLKTTINNDLIIISNKHKSEEHIHIPIAISNSKKIRVRVWDDDCDVLEADSSINNWFTHQLGQECKLVYMPEDSLRIVDTNYASGEEITGFTDGYPILLVGQASLDDLNSRLEEKLPINRFRPNIVFSGGKPYEEDEMEQFIINGIHFFGVKLCARCVITTIDQDKAEKNKEPLKTFSTYRQLNHKIYFGQNLLHKGDGTIHIHDSIEVLKRKQGLFSLV